MRRQIYMGMTRRELADYYAYLCSMHSLRAFIERIYVRAEIVERFVEEYMHDDWITATEPADY